VKIIDFYKYFIYVHDINPVSRTRLILN